MAVQDERQSSQAMPPVSITVFFPCYNEQDNVAKVTRLLWEGFGFGWAETAYSGVTFPLVEPALEHAARLNYRRIIVFPYFLFTGILVQRIYDATDAVARRYPGIQFSLDGNWNDDRSSKGGKNP